MDKYINSFVSAIDSKDYEKVEELIKNNNTVENYFKI